MVEKHQMKARESTMKRIMTEYNVQKKEIIKKAAKNIGMALNGFVNVAIDEKIQQNNNTPAPGRAGEETEE